MSSWGDDGLPDEAFTEDELAAGVHHIVRTGNPNATSSGRKPVPWSLESVDDECIDDAGDVLPSRSVAVLRFETFAQARAWSQENPGKVFMRAADGQGFEAKPVQRAQSVKPTQRAISSHDTYMNRTAEIKAMAPQLQDVLSNSGSNYYRISMRPFYRRTWEDELSRLSTVQLRRLRLLVAVHLENSREWSRRLDAEMRRLPSMRKKAGHYGEELTERLNKIMEGAIDDIDKRLTASDGDGGDRDAPF